ncbi:MAG TPA: hypothetical protein VIJ47_06900 [Acidimicrobiales bacterium]
MFEIKEALNLVGRAVDSLAAVELDTLTDLELIDHLEEVHRVGTLVERLHNTFVIAFERAAEVPL